MSLGLDLSGGVMVTYRPDFETVPERYADVPRAELLAMAKETLAGRLFHRFDTLPDVVVRSDGGIVVSLPGDHDQRQILKTVGKTYRLTFRQALGMHGSAPDSTSSPEGLILPYEGRWLDLGPELLAGDMLDSRSIRVQTSDGASLENLGQGAAVTFEFRPPYDDRFAEITAKMKGETLAILLDDAVEWAGRVEGEIRGPGVLQGGYTLQEASEVAGLLRSGNLPLSLDVESISGVGPALGQEILNRGELALAWSTGLLVLLILVAYGRRPALLLTGWASLASLLFFIVGMIGFFDLTVDLVAIAGLVLSVGMGMDAFILIFEALEGDRAGNRGDGRSEGCSPLGRLRQVYSFGGEGRTLVHANATTLLVVLLLLFSDRLRSFALFLMVGLFASLLTILVARSLLSHFSRRGWLEQEDPSRVIPWHDPMAKIRAFRPGLFRFRRLFFVGLAILLVSSAALLQVERQGSWLPLGADFQPGMQIQVALPSSQEIAPMLEDLRADFPGIEARHQSWSADSVAAGQQGYVITLEGDPWRDDAWQAAASEDAGSVSESRQTPETFTPETLSRWLEDRHADLKGIHSIDARLSGRRILASLSVLVFSFLFLGLYLGVFQSKIDRWLAPSGSHTEAKLAGSSSSVGARIYWGIFLGTVFAVLLDVVIVLVALALLGIPVSMPVIAALLTIIGYSVNDSMVLWSHLSRAPEGRSETEPAPSDEDRITEGVDRILSRTVLTSLSTMVPAATILFVGLQPLEGFAWAVLVGTVAGTLSSMFVVASFARGAVPSRRRRSVRADPDKSSSQSLELG